MNVRTLLFTATAFCVIGWISGYSVAKADDDIVHMNGNDVDCCVRYTIDNNSELEGYFYTDIKVALPLRSPTMGLKWNHDIADEDVMGLPNYK